MPTEPPNPNPLRELADLALEALTMAAILLVLSFIALIQREHQP